MMLKRFFGNKRYRFRKDIMKIVMGNSYSDANWIERVDGKEVEVITKTSGICRDGKDGFSISPRWCEEIYGEEE